MALKKKETQLPSDIDLKQNEGVQSFDNLKNQITPPSLSTNSNEKVEGVPKKKGFGFISKEKEDKKLNFSPPSELSDNHISDPTTKIAEPEINFVSEPSEYNPELILEELMKTSEPVKDTFKKEDNYEEEIKKEEKEENQENNVKIVGIPKTFGFLKGKKNEIKNESGFFTKKKTENLDEDNAINTRVMSSKDIENDYESENKKDNVININKLILEKYIG